MTDRTGQKESAGRAWAIGATVALSLGLLTGCQATGLAEAIGVGGWATSVVAVMTALTAGGLGLRLAKARRAQEASDAAAAEAAASAERDASAAASAIQALAGQVAALEEKARAMQQLAEDGVRAKEAAEAANRAKTQFLSMMSHELRTPLNAILGFSEIMRSEALGALGAAEYREFATDIYSSGAHLLSLINDLLDLAKVESGMVELKEELVDLQAVIDDSIRIVSRTDSAKGVTVASEPPPKALCVSADKRRIRQLMINLLSNAVKFTPEGRSVAVRAYQDADGGAVVEVADTGIGIAPGDIARVMQPFVQIDSDLSRSSQGTGLGLPLCKQLVDLHGGKFSLESELNKGTTVRFSLPPDRSRPAGARAA